MGAGHGAQLRGTAEACEDRKLAHVDFMSPAGFGIGDVGEPFELGRHVGQVAVLRRRQRPFTDRRTATRIGTLLGRARPSGESDFGLSHDRGKHHIEMFLLNALFDQSTLQGGANSCFDILAVWCGPVDFEVPLFRLDNFVHQVTKELGAVNVLVEGTKSFFFRTRPRSVAALSGRRGGKRGRNWVNFFLGLTAIGGAFYDRCHREAFGPCG